MVQLLWFSCEISLRFATHSYLRTPFSFSSTPTVPSNQTQILNAKSVCMILDLDLIREA